MSAITAAQRQILTDADRWNRYADRMNAKALAAGLTTVEELERNRQACAAATADRLRNWRAA